MLKPLKKSNLFFKSLEENSEFKRADVGEVMASVMSEVEGIPFVYKVVEVRASYYASQEGWPSTINTAPYYVGIIVPEGTEDNRNKSYHFCM